MEGFKRDYQPVVNHRDILSLGGNEKQGYYVESFIGKMKGELLDGEVLDSQKEAKVFVEAWRKVHNPIRPHSSLGDLTPQQFVDKYKSSSRCQKTPFLAGSVSG